MERHDIHFSESMKKILLAGIGAVATTTEKSKDILDELVEKGELTVEQGKVLNEELKHNIKEKFAGAKQGEAVADAEAEEVKSPADMLKGMSAEDIEALKAALADMDKAE